MPSARRQITINTSREHFLSVVRRFEEYPEFLPEIVESKILSHNGETHDVAFVLKLFKRVTYTLRLVATPPTGLTWTLVESNMLDHNSGGWELEATDANHCEATYFIEAGIRGFVPRAIVTKLAQITLPGILKRFKARAEQSYQPV